MTTEERELIESLFHSNKVLMKQCDALIELLGNMKDFNKNMSDGLDILILNHNAIKNAANNFEDMYLMILNGEC